MRAIIYKDYGGPDVLHLVELPASKPAKDEVVIRVLAAGVNPIDARLRAGEMKFLLPGGFPRIPGYDVAGVIEECSGNCTLPKGTRVMAFLDSKYGGAYAEFANCSESSLAAIPDSMSFEEASAMPLAASTALQSLRDHGQIKPQVEVLINGASGGVGSFAVQIAKAHGARVTGVASGKHETFVRSMGADDFIDYELQDFIDMDRRWHIIFDAAGKSTFSDARKVLTRNGTFVSTEPNLRGLIVSLVTWPCKQKGRVMLARSRADDLRELVRLYSAGLLQVSIAEVFSLEDATKAHEKLEKGGFCGKLVIRSGE